MLNWNVDNIIKELGGAKGVISFCAKHAPTRIPPNPDTIALWKFRKRIAAPWLPVVVAGWLAEGRDIADLFFEGATLPIPDDTDTPEACGL